MPLQEILRTNFFNDREIMEKMSIIGIITTKNEKSVLRLIENFINLSQHMMKKNYFE